MIAATLPESTGMITCHPDSVTEHLGSSNRARSTSAWEMPVTETGARSMSLERWQADRSPVDRHAERAPCWPSLVSRDTNGETHQQKPQLAFSYRLLLVTVIAFYR